jgi:NTP pyrophosphatase (non-canonical NTP hydrolase)
MRIRDVQKTALETRKEKGLTGFSFTAEIAMIHSEVSEALHAYQDVSHLPHDIWLSDEGKPEGVPIELADVVIFVCGLAAERGIDLELAISQKLEYNKTRPFQHGGKRL